MFQTYFTHILHVTVPPCGLYQESERESNMEETTTPEPRVQVADTMLLFSP